MSAHKVVVQVPDGLVGGAERARLHEALEVDAAETWSELGLPPFESLEVDPAPDARLADAYVAGRGLVLSARRRQEVTIAATGMPRTPAESSESEPFVQARFGDATEAQREKIVVALVQAAARASVRDLVTLDADQLGESLLGSSDPQRVSAAASILRLAATLGIAPSQIDHATLSTLVGGDNRDPYLACDELVASLPGQARLSPVFEATRQTLRQLTDSPRSLSSDPLTDGESSWSEPQAVRASIHKNFGVEFPDIRLNVADDISDDRYRLRFGQVRGEEHLVPPDEVTALQHGVDGQPVPDPVAFELDPVYGEWWPVVADSALPPPSWHLRFHGPAALVGRGLLAELRPRLAWWAPRWFAELEWQWPATGQMQQQLRERLPAVLRWLVVDGATVHHHAPILEGMTASLADDDLSVPGMVRRTRETLGAAVLGPMPLRHAAEVVPLDDTAVSEALSADSADPLLLAHPVLSMTTSTLVAVCSAETRAQVQALLSGLRDVVRIASAQELEGASLAVPSQAGV